MATYRHRISGNGPAGDVWNCVMHSTSALDIDTVHTQFNNQIVGDLLTAMQPLWHTTTDCNSTVTDLLDPVTGHATDQRRESPDVPGTSTDQMVTQGVSIVCSWTTPRPGKHGRGRIFLPGPVITSYTANGLLATAACTAVRNAAESFIADFAPYATLVLLNKATMGTTQITGARVSNKPSYQRRRMNKVAGTYV